MFPAIRATALALVLCSATAACDRDPFSSDARWRAKQEARREADMDRVEALQKAGVRLAEAGRYEEALAKWSEGLAIAEKTFGDGPYVALMLTSVGFAHANLGHFKESEAAYLRAAQIHERRKLRESSATVTLLLDMGLLFANTDRPADAELVLRRAYEAARRVHADEPDKVAYAARALADVLRRNGKAAEADAVLNAPT